MAKRFLFITASVIAISAIQILPVSTFAAEVRITEFMASNTRTLTNEFGQFSDWVEIQNTTTTNVNLFNWALTDTAGNAKWTFPATNIAAGAYMVIFLDSPERKVPGAPLHTGFSLNADGEYLALLRPNGSNATQFPVTYPMPNKFIGQRPDISYGFGVLASNFTVVTTNAAVRVRIPNSGVEGTNWLLLGFDDNSWTLGTNGVGYGPTNTFVADYDVAIAPTAPVVFYRFEETSGAVAANIGSGAGMNGSYSGVTLGSPGPQPPALNGFEPDNKGATFNGASSFVGGPAGFFNNRNAFTVGGWVNPAAIPGARIGLFGQNDCVEFGFSSGATIELWTPGGGSMQVNYPHPMSTWHHIVGVGDGTALRVYIDGVQAGQGGIGTTGYGSSAFNFNIGGGGIQDTAGNFFNGQIDEVVAYQRALTATEVLSLYQAGTNGQGVSAVNFVRTDVGPAMSNVNASAYIRIPFNVPDPALVSSLTLRMRYDDGFAAYINGTLVVRVNATEPLVFSSGATNTHSPTVVDSFFVGTNTLQAGTNILAIQGLNVAANDQDFLVGAEMIAVSLTGESPSPLFFTAPTPGQHNAGGVANPGPAIVSPSHTPNVPLDSQDIVVTTRIGQSFFPVANVFLRYRVMFGSELEVQMFDDGLHGDGATNDGVYGVTIPESASTNGQMVRWHFRATDTQGNISRWPLLVTGVAGSEYFGTVVNPGYVTSKLPIIHLFASPTALQPGPTTAQTGADSQGGDYVSLFYDGEFYDHVKMELRGNSTAGFNKKSHRLDFNRDQPFKHLPGYPRLRKTSFTADWPDQTYMRQELAFWLADQMGAPAPFYYPVRLQLNGQFYQLANHNDVHTDEYLDRIGYDPNGALYNAAGQVTEPPQSTGGFDKKTRNWDNMAGSSPPRGTDYTNMALSIAVPDLAQRRTNAYELFDIPEVLNYLVVARWVHENDDVWANMSFYKDNDGDGLWRILPFDMNLSWGAMFSEGFVGVQATNDNHKSHPLYGGNNLRALSNTGFYNRLYDTFFNVPELRQMYLRRLRTMLDAYIKPPGTPVGSTALEQRIFAARDEMAEEARLDRIWWGWPGVGGQNNFNPPANADPFGSANRTNAATTSLTNAVDEMLNQFLYARRRHFYVHHSVTNTRAPFYSETQNPASNTVAGIPAAQAPNMFIAIGALEYNPSSGNQGQEYIQLTNSNPVAVDISGWKLSGGVDFTFRPGTVILGNNVLYISPNRNAFKTRTSGPRANQSLFVVGNYNGQLSARGETLSLVNERGLLVSTNTYPGSPSLAQQHLRITEIMYHPGPTNVGSLFGQEEFEFIELKNIGPVALNLVGIHFTNGLVFTFATNSAVTNLNPGQTVVLVKNIAAYNSRYPAAIIAGIYTGSLNNNGDRITLVDSVNEEILDFTYNNSWYPITDGLGFSLVTANEAAEPDAWDSKSNWRASGNLNGSPGTIDPAPGQFPTVLVNEVLANSKPPAVDLIELWNTSTNIANIGGWYLSDDFFIPKKFRLTNGTTIAPGGYLVVNETQFNANPGIPPSFAFSSVGDEAYLFAADPAGNLLGYSHGFHFGASEEGVSLGRYITSQAEEHFVAQATNTFNATNSRPRVGPIVISEIMFRPPDINGADDTTNEFIELLNISTNTVSLFDTNYPTNSWKLKDGVDFAFTTNTTVAAGTYLLVVGFDPQTNAAALATFRAKYGLSPAVPIVGPYGGKLDNSGDHVELAAPQPPTTNGVEYFLIDKVDYTDALPWPGGADGFGASLQRIVTTDYGDDPTNWLAALPTASAAFPGGAAPQITLDISNIVAIAGSTTNLTVAATGSNLRYLWRFNGANLNETNAVIVLTNVQAQHSGTYQALVYDEAGSALSTTGLLTVIQPVSFVVQPTNQNVQPGTNVSIFAAALGGGGQVSYQWRFNGGNISNATNAIYSFTNAELYQHSGVYDVVATDGFSSATSAGASVVVLVKPLITNAPVSVTVLQGNNVTFTVGAGPVHPMLPLAYQWLITGGAVGTPTNATTATFTILNSQVNGQVRLRVSNLAGQTNLIGIVVTVLKDFDHDGIADIWEVQYGMNTNSAADASLDSDGDGMINRDEFVAGTNPTNALSLLKLFQTPTNSSVLQFDAQSNISYTLQIRTNLNTAWQSFSNLNSTNTVRSIQFGQPLTNDQLFYRVVTPRVP